MTKKLKDFIQESKNDSKFEFVRDIKTKEVLYQFFGYVSLLFSETRNENIEEDLKELKAHTILIYLGSIIESVVGYFLKEKLITDEVSMKKYFEIEDFVEIQKIKESKNLYIGKYETRKLNLKDTTRFNDLIHGLKGQRLLDKKIIEKVDYCKQMRNLLHINMLLTNEYSLIEEITKAFIYTKEIIDEIKKELIKI